MKWFHKCDLEWLKVRQKCLTATDVKDLLPITKTGRKRMVSDENYFKVLSRKLVNLTEDDCVSTGAAARGHILEPYAIDRYNEEDFNSNEWLHHWDDVIVTKLNHEHLGLAFSPDACDVPQSLTNGNKIVAINGIKTIGEVKCYCPERHLAAGYTPKDELEERWQVATAMAVCDSINTAYLLFYNPSMMKQLFIVDYDRADLTSEIEMILEIEKDWLAWKKNLNHLDCHYAVNGNLDEEQKIIDGIIKQEELNPEGEKSVVR